MSIGIIALYTNGWQVFLIPMIGFAIGFSRKGVLIDKDRLKEYYKFFFIKFGSWRSIKAFPHITVLSITEKRTLSSHTTLVSASNKQQVYRITLLTQDHYTKLLIYQANDQDEAHKEAASLADLLGLEKVVYSPGAY